MKELIDRTMKLLLKTTACVLFCTLIISYFSMNAQAFYMEFATLDIPTKSVSLIIAFNADTSTTERETIFQKYSLEQIGSAFLPNTYLVSACSMADLSSLNQEPLIDYAEPDYVYQSFRVPTLESVIPDDTRFTEQWGLTQINAPDAWATTTGSSDVIVAVIDTGIDSTHPDLEDQLVGGAIVIRRGRSIEDTVGHGTHVASTIAGRTNNNEGTAGVAWGAKIMPVKALNRRGSGNISDVALGIRWAADNGADIINMSLGGSGDSNTFRNAVDYADERGVLVIAAVGNEYANGSPTSYPAAYDNVLAVAATDRDDNATSFSSSGDYIDVAAPGIDILAATSRALGTSYISFEGTSMSTPFVSGLAALLLSVDPDLTNAELMSIIKDSAVDVGPEGWDNRTGYGRIDAAAAIATLVPDAVDDSGVDSQTNMLYLPIIMQSNDTTVNATSLQQADAGQARVFLPIVIR